MHKFLLVVCTLAVCVGCSGYESSQSGNVSSEKEAAASDGEILYGQPPQEVPIEDVIFDDSFEQESQENSTGSTQ